MPSLMSGRYPVATWTWMSVNEPGTNGLEIGAPIVLQVSEALQNSEVLLLETIEIEWFDPVGGPLSLSSKIPWQSWLDSQALIENILWSRPLGYSGAVPLELHLLGSGYWVSQSAAKLLEPKITSASLTVDDAHPMLTVGVHHDIWAPYDFYGRPHPRIMELNAPRLESALKSLERVMGVAPIPDEATDCAAPFNYGVDSLGEGFDVSDEL